MVTKPNASEISISVSNVNSCATQRFSIVGGVDLKLMLLYVFRLLLCNSTRPLLAQLMAPYLNVYQQNFIGVLNLYTTFFVE